jgi:hypothetical protein
VTVGAAVLGVIAAYGVVNPSWASAASISGSNFEIDGGNLPVTNANLVVDGASPSIDWVSTGMGTDVVKPDRPTGQGDDSFTQGTNINDTPTTITTGSIPNNKSDLKAFGIYVEHGATDSFVNVFWTRVQAPSGTTTMDFEFNQSTVRQNDISPPKNPDVNTTTIPLRTVGDILVTYFLEAGGTHPSLTIRTWNGTAWGTSNPVPASDGLAAINTTAITAANAGGLGALDAYTFGEASLKLSTFASTSDPCRTFGSVYLRSRSSATDTDENKDFIAPEPVSISNCGRINVHKTESTNTGTHSALSGAQFTLYKDVAPTGGASAGVEDKTVANTVGTCTTDASGDCSFANVQKGQYWVVETGVPTGHDAAADQHVIITAGDQVENLSFDDPLQYGHIIVIKDAQPNDAQDFTFSLDGGSTATLDDDPASATPNSHDYTVLVGQHTLLETNIPSGWVNSNLVCDDNNPTSVVKPTAVVNVTKGETVTCTYTDTYTPTAPGLTTTANVSVANTSWTDTATLTGDGTHAVTGSVAFYLCGPTAAAADCTSTANQVGGSVPVTNGSATSAATSPSAAGNYCFRAVYTSDNAYYTTAAHTNSTTECFLKRNADLTVTKTATPSFGRAYAWDVAKVVDGPDSVQVPAGTTHAFPYKVTVTHSSTDSTWKVIGQITVHNSNNVAFEGVDVTDAIDNGAGACSVPAGSDVTVPANGTAVLDYTCTYASQPSPLDGTNTATATWDDAAYFTTADHATGTADADFSKVEPSTTDQVVTVTDTLGGVLGTLDGATAENPTVFTYSVEQTAPQGTCATYPNTASVTTVRGFAQDLLAAPTVVTLDSASASASLCGGLPLGVEATAGGSFDRTFQWLIDKSVDDTDVTIDNGQTATFAYTVTVTPNGALDSGYALSGTVTVDNPNDWEDITADVTVGTDLGGGADCTVVDGQDAVIPKGEGRSFAYSCTFTGTPALTGTVTATATWDAAAAATTASSTPAPVPVSLVVATETNRTITVTDDKTDPANPVQLGTWTWDDGAHAFTYSLTKAGVASTCTDYTNVATIVETQQSDTQVVTLCDRFTGGGGRPVVNPPQGGGLPFTGDALSLLARTALALLGAGLVLLVLSRKRQSLTSRGGQP